MLRRTLLASAGAMALTGAALAADLPSRAPPPVYLPPPPIFTWTGLYVGINGGYTWAASDTISTSTVNILSAAGLNGNIGGQVAALATGSRSLNPDGFIGGGQIGYNLQFANNFVVGIEADIQGIAGATRQGALAQTGIPGALIPVTSSSVLTWNKATDYLGTVRGRLGFTITPTLLVYGTGGLAYGGVRSATNVTEQLGFSDTPVPFGNGGSISNSRVGWTAGGGLEWLFAPSWSVKVEYLYYDLGSVNYRFPVIQTTQLGSGVFPPGGVETVGVARTTTRFNGNIIRAGLNYHFNLWGPAPIVAKY
ncbi:MAG: outer membrane protein [Methylocella sp.]